MPPSDALRITPGDPKLEAAGVWVTYNGVELHVCRGNSDGYQRELREQTMKWRRVHQGEEMSVDDARDMTIALIAQHVLLDWRSFEFEGESVPATVDNRIALLQNDRDVLEFITQFSAEPRNYEKEEAARRGKKSSDGNSVVDAVERGSAPKAAEIPAHAGAQGAAA